MRDHTRTDDGVAVTLEHGDTRVADLVRLADDAGAAITAVDLRKPSLENVFLLLTGSTITEREASAADDERPTDGDDLNEERPSEEEAAAETPGMAE